MAQQFNIVLTLPTHPRGAGWVVDCGIGHRASNPQGTHLCVVRVLGISDARDLTKARARISKGIKRGELDANVTYTDQEVDTEATSYGIDPQTLTQEQRDKIRAAMILNELTRPVLRWTHRVDPTNLPLAVRNKLLTDRWIEVTASQFISYMRRYRVTLQDESTLIEEQPTESEVFD